MTMDTYYTTDFDSGPEFPTINVSAPLLYYPVKKLFPDMPDEDFDIKIESAYELIVEQFWYEADCIAKDVWDNSVNVYSAGRSGKHLIVAGIPLVPDRKWKRFQARIAKLFAYCTNPKTFAKFINIIGKENDDNN